MKNTPTTFGVLALALLAAVIMTGCNCNNQPAAVVEKTDNGKIAIDNIMTRTSIRSFTDRAVSADTIEMLLRAGMAAPTAVNKQPWHFVVVNDRFISYGYKFLNICTYFLLFSGLSFHFLDDII